MKDALSEEIVCRDDRVLNPDQTDYKMPTALDVPRTRSILNGSPTEFACRSRPTKS